MSIVWHRQPTGDEETGDAESRRDAVVRWVASGPLSTKEALDAGLPIQRNDPHPDWGSGDPRRARSPRIIATGYRVITVEARFEVPSTGDTHSPETPSESNPLVFNWQTIQESVAIDRDRDGNAILTAARRGVEGVTQVRNYKRLTITRWQASYDNLLAMAFENRINSDSWEGAEPGEVKCAIIQPSQSYDADAALIPVDHVFDFKAISLWGDHPHQTQFLHADSVAMATINSTPVRRKIYTTDGEPAGVVPLDNEGKPLAIGELSPDLTYLRSDDPELGVEEDPDWVAVQLPAGAQAFEMGEVWGMRYLTLPEADFNNLGLL